MSEVGLPAFLNLHWKSAKEAFRIRGGGDKGLQSFVLLSGREEDAALDPEAYSEQFK